MSVPAVLAGIPLCKISRWVEGDPVISETHGTAQGVRRDHLTLIRSWRITLTQLTREERESLFNAVTSTPGVLPFWIDEFPGSADTHSIPVYVTAQTTREARWQDGALDNRGGGITLEVEAAEPGLYAAGFTWGITNPAWSEPGVAWGGSFNFTF